METTIILTVFLFAALIQAGLAGRFSAENDKTAITIHLVLCLLFSFIFINELMKLIN